MGMGTGRMLWSSAPYAPAYFPILLFCANVVERCSSAVPVRLSLCHCCHLLVPLAPNLLSPWPRESPSLSHSYEALRMEEKTLQTSQRGLTMQGGVFRDVRACVPPKTSFWCSLFQRLSADGGGWGEKALSMSNPQHTSQGAAWQSRALLMSAGS